LSNLIGILEKGAAYAEAKKVDPTVLINMRLYPDMLPLSRQVQIACDLSRLGFSRLAGREMPTGENKQTSFPELIQLVQGTIADLQTLTPAEIDGTEAKAIELPMGKMTLSFDGQSLLLYFILPNVYFHVTTTYAILRHCGVELGKLDFLGKPQSM
jgi:hypothetical protein